MVKFWALAGAVTIETGNNTIKFKEDGGATRTATVAAGTYYVDGQGDAGDLLAAIATAMDAAGALGRSYALAYTGKVNSGAVTGAVTVTTSAGTVQLIAASTTFDMGLIGFPTVDSAVAASLTSSLSPSTTWTPDQPIVDLDPAQDVSKTFQTMTPSGKSYVAKLGESQELYDLAFEVIEGQRVWTWQAEAEADSARSFQSWRRLAIDGRPVRVYKLDETAGDLAAATAADLLGVYVLHGDILSRLPKAKHPDSSNAFDFTVGLHPYVS